MKGTTKVTLIRAALAIDGRWAIGRVPSTSDEIQLPTVVDPRDGTPRPYVPATGLAGSLRRHLCDELATTWLGPEPPDWEEAEASGKARERVASRLVLVGTSLDWAGVNTRVEHRGVTSVDPERRAAHRGGLRTEEWNHPVTVTLAMTHEDEADATLLDALESWTPTVGRASSTGMGAAHIKRVEHLTLDLRDANEFTWWLNQRNLWLLGADTEALPATARSTVVDVDDKPRSGASWSIGWEVREPLHIGSGDNSPAEPTSGSQVQHTMTVGGKPLIPGSSWKGVVRGRVETILSLIDAPRKSELINHLFGSTQHGRGLLGFEDSVVEPNSIPGGKLQNRTHVAIDRFTGGARDGGLFVVEAVPAKTPLTLTIRSDHPLPEPVRNLLRHVFRDINDGLIGVGGMVTRGYGGLQLATRSDAEPVGRPVPIDIAALEALLVAPTDTEPDGTEREGEEQ